MAYIGQGIKQGTFKVLDTSGNTYNGSNTTFSLGTQVGSAAQLIVSHDGVIQLPGTDYTLASGGASITFSTAPASGASIFIVEISGAVGGTVTPSDNSVGITQLNVSDGSNGQALTTNGSGTLSFSTISTGLTGIDDQSSSNDDQLTITDTAVVVNEDSDDVDFRVESNGNANMLVVNGGDDRVGIASDPDLGSGLHIKISDTGADVSSSHDQFVIEKNGDMGMTLLGSNSAGCFIAFGDDGDNDRARIGYDHNTDRLTIKTAGTDHFRYHSSGRFSIGTTSSTHTIHTVDNIAGNYVAHFDNQNDSASHPYGLKVNFSAQSPDDNVSQAFIFADSSGSKFIVFSDGDVQNHDNSYGSISDEKVKEQITDASSQWDDIKALKVRKFKMKEDVAKGDSDEHWRLGVVAQELETAGMSGLVKNNPDMEEDIDTKTMKETGTTTKSVKYSILYMKAVKALQEAMTRIETLEAKVKTLEEG